jgi:cytidylate kinase
MHNAEELINRQITRWNMMRHMVETANPIAETSESERVLPPRHPVITISRQIGAGAREIAAALCNRLNYDLMGKSLIDAVAKDLHVQQRLVDALDEHSRNDLQLMLESYATGREIEANDYFQSLARIVRAVALQGGVVFIGRGAGFILRDLSALNILVVAPIEDRVQRLMRYENITDAIAREKLLKSDHDRAQFFAKMFKIDVKEPTHYDLVINTARLEPRPAARLVEEALALRGFSLEELRIDLTPHTLVK